MKKKILMVLTLIFVLCALSLTLIACGGGNAGGNSSGGNGGNSSDGVINPPEILQPSEGLEYVLINNRAEYKVVDIGSCTDIDIVIPSTYRDLPVTKIENWAFKYDVLTSVVIPDSVTSIGSGAFDGCSSLTSVVIGNSVESIGEGAFSGCDSLTSIEIPNSVTSIGGYAFQDCKSLTSIEIPNSVESIGYEAFSSRCFLTIYCEAESTPSGWSSGWNRNSWDASCLPVVWDCNNNDVADDGYIYTVVDGVRYSLSDGVATVAQQPVNITTANIKSSITYKGNTYSVTSIGGYAFSGCKSLTSVVIGNSVKSIGEGAFSGCDSLTSIEIPNSVTSIGSKAFYDCDSLTSIKIPNSVTSIGGSAFSGYVLSSCDSLTIYCEAESQPSGWHSSWDIGCSDSKLPVVWDCNNNDVANDGYNYTVIDGLRYGIKDGVATVAQQPVNITTANIKSSITYKGNTYSVTSIGDGTFWSCHSLKSVVIPNSVTSIGSYAFEQLNALESVVIGNSVESIGDGTFYNCDSLTSVVIGNSVESIGEGAFRNCDSLASIVIPDSVTNIGKSAFRVCKSLTNITVDKDNKNYKSMDGNLYSKDGKGLIQYAIGKLDKRFIIPSTVTSIGDDAFGYCDSLTSIVIPNSVTSIGDDAFYNCKSLTSVVIGNSVESIGEGAFYNCDSLTSVVIGNSVESIGEGAFRNCDSLASIVIPDSVTSIGDWAFNYCTSLTSIEIPNSVESIGEYAFRNCDSLTIYCEAESKPSGWSSDWNWHGRPVVWGYKD